MHDTTVCFSPRHPHQWFLTWLSVRPGKCLAISAQRFPSSRCCLLRVASSSSDHSHLRMVGSAPRREPGLDTTAGLVVDGYDLTRFW